MSSYYFAARYSRHPEMRIYRDDLLAAIPGAEVTSRWIDCHNDELEASYTPEVLNADPEGCWRHGAADVEDMLGADTIVSFTSADGGGKGGRHVEFGFGLGLEYVRLVIVGPRENVFHCNPDVEVFPDFWAFLDAETTR